MSNDIKNCWEFMNCPPENRNNCLVFQNNMGNECWLLMASKASCPASKKVGGCFNCSWYKKFNQ